MSFKNDVFAVVVGDGQSPVTFFSGFQVEELREKRAEGAGLKLKCHVNV